MSNSGPEDVSPSRFSGLNSSPGNLCTYMCMWAWLPNRQEVLSSLNIIFSHILQLHLAYRRVHWIRLIACACGHRSSAASCVPCDALMNWQQPLTSTITPVLKSLHWLKIPERIHFKVLSLTYNSLQSS